MSLPGGREAEWDTDGTAGLEAQVMRDGMLVGYVPQIEGSECFSGCAGTGAIDGGDRGPMGYGKVNDLLARQAAVEGEDPAIVDDRHVEALPLSAHINADPHSQVAKDAPSAGAGPGRR